MFLQTHNYDTGNFIIKEKGKDALFFTLCAIIENPDHPLYRTHAEEIIKELWGTDHRYDYEQRKLAKIGYRTFVGNSLPDDITEWNVVERLCGHLSWYNPLSEDQKLLIPVLSAIATNTNHPLHKEYGSEAQQMMTQINKISSGNTDTSDI